MHGNEVWMRHYRDESKATIAHPPNVTVKMATMPEVLYSSQKSTDSPFQIPCQKHFDFIHCT